MKLTTRGRYAVTAMLDLAIHDGAGPTSLADIASRQDISLSYLEQLFAQLRRSGLVVSTRGPGGGYRLGPAGDTISVAAVIDAVHESVDATKCGGQRNCRGEERCLTHDLWEDLSMQIRGFLDQVTLDDLVQRRSAGNGGEHALNDMRTSHAVGME
ncbi:MAG: Rrf2 family transcriptional regulator [Gammaproteobacteria bacterium]|nr:Rrf2 family transcriptional regulator [Gammaproteobacteria bacterium]NNM00693.1 Rrf2 family transcriptional regulator [Gammaproteobacteria bacterium]